MERSSPLAAMQAPSLPFGQWGCRGEAQPSYSEYGGGRLNFGPSSFNFKDLSMKKAPMDYFSLKPVRGSSPTASLAADLSQNFHIDQSPQLPTPRRSLFSSNLFGTINERTTTPPIPSSSPGPGNDSMEISPLPHKAPFVVPIQVEPTPQITPMEEDITTTMEVVQDSPLDSVKQFAPQERRRPSLMRPSLSRTKGFTTTSVSLKPVRVECPPFKFGNGPSMAPQTLMSPEECFDFSPQREKRPQSAHSPAPLPMGPPRFRQPFSGLNGHLRSVGSPIVGHVRKPSNPLQRPRKQFRRSLSMFEHPGDIMKQQEKASFVASGLDSIMDTDDTPQLKLPHFNSDEESLPRITKETMIDVLDGKFGQCYDRSVVIDCRFEYEYEGGHIEGAINVNDKDRLANQLFESPPLEKTLLIFHCEYSAHRAPIMAKFLRHKDRACNAHQYPILTYPEVYILDGGYSSFFVDHKYRCFPQNYVEMADKEHANACERGLGRIKQQRTKLCRAQTFAFGQHGQQMDDSPTAAGRQSSSLMSGMDIAADEGAISRRMATRRLVSF